MQRPERGGIDDGLRQDHEHHVRERNGVVPSQSTGECVRSQHVQRHDAEREHVDEGAKDPADSVVARVTLEKGPEEEPPHEKPIGPQAQVDHHDRQEHQSLHCHPCQVTSMRDAPAGQEAEAECGANKDRCRKRSRPISRCEPFGECDSH